MSQTVKRIRKRTDWGPRQAASGLRGWLPHAYVMPGSPLFNYAARNLPLGHTPDVLIQRTRDRLWQALLFLAVLVVSAGTLTLMINAQTPDGTQINLLAGIAAVLLLGSFLDRLGFDFTVMLGAINTLDDEIRSGRYDLIRVTPVRSNDIVRAHFAAAQIPHWRGLSFRVGLHLLAGGLLVVNAVFVAVFLPEMNTYPVDDNANVFWLLVDGTMLVGFLLVILAVFLIEPRLRLNVLSALGLAISALGVDGSLRLLAGGAAVLIFWAVQIALLYLPVTLVNTLFSLEIGTGLGAVYLIVSVALPLVIYNGYKLLWVSLLSYTARRLDTLAD